MQVYADQVMIRCRQHSDHLICILRIHIIHIPDIMIANSYCKLLALI